MSQIISYILFTVLILVIVKKYLDKKGHPKALFYLFFAEMWERFSFYGMRALLVLYLIKDFMSDRENNEEIAYGIYASYGALVYLTPLIGGYLADKFIGYRKSIIFGGILMALGHFCMAFQNEIFFYGALGLLIIGNGFFKPNISTLVGSLYPEGDPKRDSGFTIFYMGINTLPKIAEKLVEHGRDINTPAALIRKGTQPEQKTYRGTIGNLAELVEKHNITPPTLIVIGDVVNQLTEQQLKTPGFLDANDYVQSVSEKIA